MALTSLSGEGKWKEEKNHTEGFVSPSALERACRCWPAKVGREQGQLWGSPQRTQEATSREKMGKSGGWRARGQSLKDEAIPLPMGHVSRPCHTRSWSFAKKMCAMGLGENASSR